MLIIYGNNTFCVNNKMVALIGDGVTHTTYSNCDVYVNERYYTGLPDKPVWKDNIGLLLHGIAFPWEISIDEMAENPEPHLQFVIGKYKNNLQQIARGFRNGSYAGVVLDNREKSIYAFTSFLNSIPVYYSIYKGCLIVSTDFYLIACLTESKLREVTLGLVEYYVQGTNLSSETAFDHIKTIPKGGYLKFSRNRIEVDYYYTMPQEEPPRKFDDYVDEFAHIWDGTIQSIHSSRFKYGLGLTGGIDSRLIFSAMRDKKTPLFFTGSHPKHPDYILANKITASLNIDNHVLEDYRQTDKLSGYANYVAMGDNPLNNNSFYYLHQINFRKDNGLIYDLIGLTEFLGGVYHYTDRRSITSTIKMCLPVCKSQLISEGQSAQNILIDYILRNNSYREDLRFYSTDMSKKIAALNGSIYDLMTQQIGYCNNRESFLERARHIYKMSNLLAWSRLGGRRISENLSPSMNIEVTDFTSKIPLTYRDSRRILLAYLKRYHPETAKFVLSGYILSAKSPWLLYKMLSPQIKVLNHLGIKIPILQWYVQKHNYTTGSKMAELYEYQRVVCQDSEFIQSTEFKQLLNQYPNDKIRLMRIFNIAMLDKKLQMTEKELEGYMLDKVEEVRHGF